MNANEFLVDLSTIDMDKVLAGPEEIRACNMQRFEMEQLTAVVSIDTETASFVGYKDTSRDDFWVRGHMPGMPLMPGVIMLEAVAQLCSYVVQKMGLMTDCVVGFGGLDEVRFRDMVLPGDRLVILGKLIKSRKNRLSICQFQGVVREHIVVEGILRGVALPAEAIQQRSLG